MSALVRNLGRAALGVVLGLAVAEGAFWLRDQGGFPHLNAFVADPELGVRLQPHRSGAIRLGPNPVARWSIDAAGYRGGHPAPTGPDGIVVVGDSQVFGLGVADDETLPAQLARQTGRPVRNGGVVTYGPEEYLAVLDEQLAATEAGTGIVVFNFANDLFELGSPNTGRHAVWDGWAVRVETAPEHTTSFPGRSWLFNRSHLVYAFRRWLHDEVPGAQPPAYRSEGDWDTVLAELVAERPPEDVAATSTDAAELTEALRTAVTERERARREAASAFSIIAGGAAAAIDADEVQALEARRRGAQPGDIVYDRYTEASRPIPVTAEMLAQGAKTERRVRDAVERWIRENPDDWDVKRLREAEAREGEARASIAELASRVVEELEVRSPYDRFLDDARRITASHGAELMVVALPLDVQVDPGRFAEYGAEPIDMTESLGLLDQLVADAQARGVRAVSLVEPLREAGSGTFLQGDLHLTAQGQAAAAEAVAAVLAAPAPVVAPGPGLPQGRTHLPLAQEWAIWDENLVRGSSRNHCATTRIREWQRVRCTTPPAGAARAPQDLLGADTLELLARLEPGVVDFVVPVGGRARHVWLQFADRVERLTLPADEGSAPFFETVDADEVPAGIAAPPGGTRGLTYEASWDIARADAACDRGEHLPSRKRACMRGELGSTPLCADGEAATGPGHFCRPLCSAERPCAVGHCTPVGNGAVCL